MTAERALLADMGVLTDPFARRMLTPSMAAIFWVVQHWPYGVRARSVTLAGLAARVLWFDAQVANALDGGIKQIAVIGAGYDSRAWRLRRDGVQFFELDHGGTLRRRFSGMDSTHHGPLSSSSKGSRCISARRSFDTSSVSWGDRARVGSRLAVDFYPPRDAGTSRDHRQLRLQRLARTGSGEEFRLAVDRRQAVELVEASGWDVIEEMSMPEAARALVPRESGLPVDAVNQHKALVAGLRS